MGFEPTTLSLARRCSTTEPLPLTLWKPLYRVLRPLSIVLAKIGKNSFFEGIAGLRTNSRRRGLW